MSEGVSYDVYQERVEPRPGGEEAQEGSERPWWRRVFGA
jgi:hypothetical protein